MKLFHYLGKKKKIKVKKLKEKWVVKDGRTMREEWRRIRKSKCIFFQHFRWMFLVAKFFFGCIVLFILQFFFQKFFFFVALFIYKNVWIIIHFFHIFYLFLEVNFFCLFNCWLCWEKIGKKEVGDGKGSSFTVVFGWVYTLQQKVSTKTYLLEFIVSSLSNRQSV